MATDMADGDAVAQLAAQIMSCLVTADACRLHTVAAHLDMALVALRGTGVWPPDLQTGVPL